MTKYFISFLALVGLASGVCGVAWAHAEEGDAIESVEVEGDLPISITIAQVSETLDDEGVGILPNSSWYFFKEWRRGFQRFFAFGAEKKVELELKIADEKARELKVVEAKDPNDDEAIVKAFENYAEAKELLEARFTSLTKVLNDKNREKAEELLDKWDDQFDRHRALFEELAERHSDIPEVEEISEKLDWIAPVAKFRGNMDDLAEQLRRTQDTEEFEEAVEEIEDLKEDIREGVEARGGFRTDCAVIVRDIDALKARLRTGKIDPQDFARQVGVLIDEKKKCEAE